MKRARYDLLEHRHRFAKWAAARAAQRGRGGSTNRILMKALEASGIRRDIARPAFLRMSQEQFDEHHARWCNRILRRLVRSGVREASFGRAAKLVAIYLKVMVVLAGDTRLAALVHPPIDALLLKALSKRTKDRNLRRDWASRRWTKLSEDEYAELLLSLRSNLDVRPLWMIEEHWDGNRDS